MSYHQIWYNPNMILYHGSNVVVEKPMLVPNQRRLDFGSGFYTTSNKEQAERFAFQVARRTKTDTRFVSVFDYDENNEATNLKVLRFISPDEEWLDFVQQNRLQGETTSEYDLIIGPVANDDVFATLQLCFLGILTREQTLEALKIKKLYDQFVFKSEKAIRCLNYSESYIPKED